MLPVDHLRLLKLLSSISAELIGLVQGVQGLRLVVP